MSLVAICVLDIPITVVQTALLIESSEANGLLKNDSTIFDIENDFLFYYFFSLIVHQLILFVLMFISLYYVFIKGMESKSCSWIFICMCWFYILLSYLMKCLCMAPEKLFNRCCNSQSKRIKITLILIKLWNFFYGLAFNIIILAYNQIYLSKTGLGLTIADIFLYVLNILFVFKYLKTFLEVVEPV